MRGAYHFATRRQMEKWRRADFRRRSGQCPRWDPDRTWPVSTDPAWYLDLSGCKVADPHCPDLAGSGGDMIREPAASSPTPDNREDLKLDNHANQENTFPARRLFPGSELAPPRLFSTGTSDRSQIHNPWPKPLRRYRQRADQDAGALRRGNGDRAVLRGRSDLRASLGHGVGYGHPPCQGRRHRKYPVRQPLSQVWGKVHHALMRCIYPAQ